jgi:hypothetical protein
MPATGECFIYLVQGVDEVCGAGSLGFGANGLERINENPEACTSP